VCRVERVGEREKDKNLIPKRRKTQKIKLGYASALNYGDFSGDIEKVFVCCYRFYCR
jgi:hypothetical protein